MRRDIIFIGVKRRRDDDDDDDDHHHHHPDEDDDEDDVCEKDDEEEEEEFVVVSGGIDDDDDAVRLSKLDRIVERFSRAGRRRGEATRRTGAGDGTSSVVVVFAGIVAREERDRIERERYAEKKTGWARSSSVHGRHE